ncbi:hypothetical protein [Streptomyces sp. H39-C1]|uniref:hypothetical protein n=1 Tax=Streptomyces sp. H39-C1 TaxID=3004355 RepID=UPI0022AEADFD|nr:hypothetical protein [Streptomyces sp. H39-C1]MCZ4098021.1 hypothetical protein [Streptomyces sp. H39-C1]
MPHIIALKHPLDETGLARQLAPPPPALVVTDVTQYNHPLFQSVAPGRYAGDFVYSFGGFTGREPKPEVPVRVYDDTGITRDQRSALYRQYTAATVPPAAARGRPRAAQGGAAVERVDDRAG